MSRDKQLYNDLIEIFDEEYEKRNIITPQNTAEKLAEKGYRKVDEDYAKQCTCYALGCQMAKQLEQKVAMEFIEAVDEMMECICAMTGVALTYYGRYPEVKMKYTEGERREDAKEI